jgi:hypothetical protein
MLRLSRNVLIIGAALSAIVWDQFAYAEGRRLTPAELFSVYASLFSGAPFGPDEFKQIEPGMRKEGFSATNVGRWVASDASGDLIVLALPEQRSYLLTYVPKHAVPFGDAALGALIQRAESIVVSDADTIELRIRARSLSKGTSTGERTETVSFSLIGGAWVRTTVSINWSN